MPAIEPTPLQAGILAYRSHVMGIASLGGRGSGKSVGLQLDVIDHCRLYGPDAVVLVTREQWAALQELQTNLFELATLAFPGSTRNKSEGVIQCGNGAAIYFTNVSDADSYAKIQGRSCSMLAADEIGNYTPMSYQFVQRIRSNLRAKPGQRVRMHITGNPLGRSHHRLYKDFVTASPPWKPFRERGTGDWWVWANSDLTANPHVDQTAYLRQLHAATATDAALRLAWVTGQWSPMGGNMFAKFDPTVHILDVAPTAFLGPVKTIMGGDFGLAAPSVALVGTKLYEQRGKLQRGSILIRDECATVADWNDLTTGDGTPPVQLARRFLELGRPYNTRTIVMDDSRGISSPDETVVKILNREGMWATKPYAKDRVGGWAYINQLLHNATTGEGPGLYISEKCRYLLETLPEAPRDELRREDIALRYAADHALDALSYLLRELREAGNPNKQTRVIGAW